MESIILSQVVTLATPIFVPILVAVLKEITDRVPKASWPLLAVLLGVALDFVNYFLTGGGLGPIGGALLGAAGIGIRESQDQIRKYLKGENT